MLSARVIVDRSFAIGDIDRRLFGSFVEHIGRCVYGGIFEPGHPTADEHGFRTDVLDLTRELGVTLVRYPGGNFVSGYNWEDGVGPVEDRPRRLDLAWFATEPNAFGTNEFVTWCRKASIEPMMCLNLGTRGPDEARDFIEYCNHPGGTALSDLRRAHGFEEPHGIRFWNLGNEMDGPWQIGHRTAAEYGRIAQETAKVARWVDPTLELSACGSSNNTMSTFGAWEYEVLDLCYAQVDYISLHMYFTDPTDKLADFFTDIESTDRFIKQVVAICDAAGAKHRSGKTIMLCFDEYNVWWKIRKDGLKRIPGWPVAPSFNEEIYTFEDALVLGGAILVLLNNCDRVKAACLAQLVNVIAPIMTETGGPAWRQTIFFPFAHAARLARGRTLRTAIESPTYLSKAGQNVRYLVAAVTEDEASGHLAVFALNRHLDQPLQLSVELRGFPCEWRIEEAIELTHPDRKAVNSREAPEHVMPHPHTEVRIITNGMLEARLEPLSWSVFSLVHATTRGVGA